MATVDDLTRFDLLGYSFGGAVAAHLARSSPGRVRSLTLLDPALGLEPDFVLPKARASVKNERFASPDEARRHLAARAEGLDDEQIAQRVTDDLVPADDGRWRWRTEDAAVVTGFSEACRAVSAAPAGLPVLLVRAAHNPRGSRPTATVWADAVAVRQVTLECGHQLLVQRPAEVAALVAQLLTRGS